MTTKSGYLNNPPKIIVLENDNRPGSYPSNASPINIEASKDKNIPYRDNITSFIFSPYAYAKIKFITGIPENGSTITIVSSDGISSIFRFTTESNALFNPAPGIYNIISSDAIIGAGDYGLDSSRVAHVIAQRFVSAIAKAPESHISADLSSVLGEVTLRQTIPGSSGNTSIVSTVGTTRVSVENFSGGNSSEIRYPYAQVVDDTLPETSEIIRRVIKSNRSGTLSAPGNPDPRRLVAPSDQHYYVNYSPYNETDSIQAFGIVSGSSVYGTQTQLYDNFFTRGFILGPLDEPLGAKDKIVIDLTPITSTSIWSASPSNGGPNPMGFDNHHMMYYNFEEKKWDRLGFGYTYNESNPTFSQWLDNHYIGFSQNCNNISIPNPDLTGYYETEVIDNSLKQVYDNFISLGSSNKKNRTFINTGYASPIDTFGFPLHPKFHATSSQVLDVSKIIDRPFLVEKLVYEFSGSAPKDFLLGAVYEDSAGSTKVFRSPAATFFILNQRKANPDPGQEESFTNVYIARTNGSDGPPDPLPYADFYLPPKDQTDFRIERYDNGGIPQNRVLSPGGPSVYVDTIRDLVTFARVGAVWPTYNKEVVDTLIPGFPHPAEFMDLAIEVPASGTFDGIYTLSAGIKSPSANPAISVHVVQTGSSNTTGIVNVYTAKDTSTRNSLDIPTGRSYNSEFSAASLLYKAKNVFNPANITTTYGIKKDFENSPYIIMPGDKLIFGWQSSFTDRSSTASGPFTPGFRSYGYPLVIGPGAGKLVLYGSYLRDNKPVHNIFKDQLISDSIHEAIPSGPAVLDQFDTEPTMTYTGSMREEYIRGSMYTVGEAGEINITPVSSKSIRKVRGSASDGNLQNKASFFRNTRHFEYSSQYYDSMQPNPVDVLITNNGYRSYGVYSSVITGSYMFLGLPGESYENPTLESGSNRSFIGSFAFDKTLYSGISRIKKINSKVFRNAKITTRDSITGAIISPRGIDVIGYLTGSSPSSSVSSLVMSGGLRKNSISGFGPQNDGILYPLSTTLYDTNPSDSETSQFGVSSSPPFPIKGIFDGVWNFISPNLDFDDVNYHLSRLMGCFGDGYLGITQYYENLFWPGYLWYSALGSIPAALPAMVFPFPADWFLPSPPPAPSTNILFGQIYRGMRYGLVNALPYYANCVFSGVRYGQFRDILEQRQFTIFEDETQPSGQGYPVEVIFVSRDGYPGNYTIVSGSETNSSNISNFATSEHPFDDSLSDYGQIWDRETALPETFSYFVSL